MWAVSSQLRLREFLGESGRWRRRTDLGISRQARAAKRSRVARRWPEARAAHHRWPSQPEARAASMKIMVLVATAATATAMANASATGGGTAIGQLGRNRRHWWSRFICEVRLELQALQTLHHPDAATGDGALAQAQSTAIGSSGQAQSTAKTSFAYVSVQSTAVAPTAGGTATTNAIAQGGSGQAFVNPGQTAYAFSTASPNKAYAANLIGGASTRRLAPCSGRAIRCSGPLFWGRTMPPMAAVERHL